MKQKTNSQIILAFIFFLGVAACKSKDKQPDDKPGGGTDTSSIKTKPDAVTASPGLYKILADTLGIRVIEVNYQPGDSSGMHSHTDYAIIVTGGGTGTFYNEDGTSMTNEMKTGMTMVRPGEVHSVKNTGNTPVKAILVEVNRSAQTAAQDAAMDAAKVAPEVYKAVNDTLGIRVLEITAKAGGSVAMHSHPDGVIYVMEGGMVEFTNKEGKKMTNELKAGMTMVLPAEAHSAKNIGKNTLKAVLVEVNRAMK